MTVGLMSSQRPPVSFSVFGESDKTPRAQVVRCVKLSVLVTWYVLTICEAVHRAWSLPVKSYLYQLASFDLLVCEGERIRYVRCDRCCMVGEVVSFQS